MRAQPHLPRVVTRKSARRRYANWWRRRSPLPVNKGDFSPFESLSPVPTYALRPHEHQKSRDAIITTLQMIRYSPFPVVAHDVEVGMVGIRPLPQIEDD